MLPRLYSPKPNKITITINAVGLPRPPKHRLILGKRWSGRKWFYSKLSHRFPIVSYSIQILFSLKYRSVQTDRQNSASNRAVVVPCKLRIIIDYDNYFFRDEKGREWEWSGRRRRLQLFMSYNYNSHFSCDWPATEAVKQISWQERGFFVLLLWR